jgi:hypothetical protein
MKRGLLFLGLVVFLGIVFQGSFVLAGTCDLNVQMINQDPYPAIPGEYVDVVFQVSGVEEPNCGQVSVTLVEEFPFYLDPNSSSTKTIQAGTFSKDFGSFLIVPYKIRVDEDALDGDNPIEIKYTFDPGSDSVSTLLEEFMVNIEDTRTDFEISIRDYDKATGTLEFDILNIGESDIEALTIEIPKQEGIDVKGSRRNIVGSLDSNEDTSFSFEAIPKDGEITLNVLYTDKVNVRRTIEKTIEFDSSYFEGRVSDQKSTPWITIVVFLVVVVGFIWWILKRRKNKKDIKHKH